MATSVSFNGSTYSIPASGEVAWASLSNFLIAVANNAQTTGKQIQTIRTALTTPVTVAATDYGIITNLTSPGAVAVTLPSGVNGQIFAVIDGKGDAATNNVTVSGTAQNIRGASTYVISANYGAAVFQFSTTENQWEVVSEVNVVPIAKGGTGAITASAARTNLGLGNVDNTSDATKNAAVATLTNKTLTAPVINSPTGLVKADVGLGNVDNTSDATKNAAVATLTNKTLTSPVINSPTGLVKADVGLGNVDNTSDATKNAATATLTNKTLTSPVINSPTGLVKADVGLGSVTNDAQLKIASNLSDVASASTARNNILPSKSGNSAKVLAVNVGETDVEWVPGASATLSQYHVDVGNSSNTRAPLNTNLLGFVPFTQGQFTFASTDVSTGSDTITISSHGIATGTTIYFTTAGSLFTATGVAVSSTLYAISASSSTIKVATSYANAISGTSVDITAAGSGNSTIFFGGAVPSFNRPDNYSFRGHKNGSNVTWNILNATPTKVTFGTVSGGTGYERGPASMYSSSTATIPSGMGGEWEVDACVSWNAVTATQVYTIYIYKNGSSLLSRDFSLGVNSASGANELATFINTNLVFAANDTVEIYLSSSRNHTSVTATLVGSTLQTWFRMRKVN